MPAPTCSRCGGEGWYMYDHNHGKPCEECCRHDQGVWQLFEHYGNRNGSYCCRAGCGTIWPNVVLYADYIEGLSDG